MSVSERLKVATPAIQNWEKDYLQKNKSKLNKREIAILEGDELKSHEGMIYGIMYAQWKKDSGFDW